MKHMLSLIISVLTYLNVGAQATDSALFYFEKGMSEKSARRYLVASKHFDKAIGFNSKFMQAFIENGKVNLEMRKVDAALVNFTRANLLEPDNAEAIKQLSGLYFNNRQFQKAMELAQKCNSCPEADKIIAMSNYHLGDYGKAVVQLEKVLANSPSDAAVCYALAASYLELDQEKTAIAYYKRAIALDTLKINWVYELGLLYYNQAQYADAVHYFEKAANGGYPKSNEYYENLGFAYLFTNDIEKGMENLSTVLARKPNNVTLLTDIGQAMYQAKRYDDALVYFQKAIDLNPKDARSLYMTGIIFLKKGQKEKGQAMCDKAISIDPTLAEKRQSKRGDQFGL